MNVVDLVLVVAMLIFAVTGWRKGFLYGLLSLMGFPRRGSGWPVAGAMLLGRWEDGLPKALTALVMVFFLATMGQVLVGMFGRRLHGAVDLAPCRHPQSAPRVLCYRCFRSCWSPGSQLTCSWAPAAVRWRAMCASRRYSGWSTTSCPWTPMQ